MEFNRFIDTIRSSRAKDWHVEHTEYNAFLYSFECGEKQVELRKGNFILSGMFPYLDLPYRHRQPPLDRW